MNLLRLLYAVLPNDFWFQYLQEIKRIDLFNKSTRPDTSVLITAKEGLDVPPSPDPDSRIGEIDPSRVELFFKAFESKTALGQKQQLAARLVIQHTTFVTFREWKTALTKAVSLSIAETSFVSEPWMPGGLNTSVVFETTKSNLWVLRLVLQWFPDCRSNFVPDPFLPLTKHSSQKIRHIVFFDDAIYSGSQMSENLLRAANRVPSESHLDFLVICAFLSDRGRDKIETEMQRWRDKTKKKLKLSIFAGERLLNMAQKVNNADESKLVMDIFPSPPGFDAVPKYPYIFSFKTPDHVSSFPELYSGYVPPLPPERAKEQIVPLRTGCQSVVTSSKESSEPWKNPYGFLTSDVECPLPPYKL